MSSQGPTLVITVDIVWARSEWKWRELRVCDGCRQGRMRQALLAADIGGPDLSHEVSKQNRACSIL